MTYSLKEREKEKGGGRRDHVLWTVSELRVSRLDLTEITTINNTMVNTTTSTTNMVATGNINSTTKVTSTNTGIGMISTERRRPTKDTGSSSYFTRN